ncbi:MAG: DUF3025 domain-containing protein, partial [Burkholderiales bacterium]|nr:DUF3025 domain-containing protein [Burkholderiales bacterium]
MLDTRDCVISNVNEKRIRFVRQDVRPKRFEQKFEPRTYLRGEVLVRTENWHDLFNALVWMTFPFTKAAINARHYELLQGRIGGQRSAVGDALTLFDEDGIVALSSDKRVLELVRQFRWRELFWECREIVRSEMRFVVFGHAMYEKALRPFVGMTAKSILLHVPGKMLDLPGAAFNDAIDQRVAAYVRDPRNLTHGKALAPLPVLGIPGWWPQNEASNF